MIEIKELVVPTCCGKTQINLEINKPFIKDYLKLFIDNNFTELKRFTEAGIFYVESSSITASCPFGSNRIQIKCKNKETCREGCDYFKSILSMIE